MKQFKVKYDAGPYSGILEVQAEDEESAIAKVRALVRTAGNYFIVDEDDGRFVTLDPNGKFDHELLKRYNNYPELAKENATLLEQNRELKEALRVTLAKWKSISTTFKGKGLGNEADTEISRIEALLNKYPEI